MVREDFMRYRYPAEKFAAARRTLMAPHPDGELARRGPVWQHQAASELTTFRPN